MSETTPRQPTREEVQARLRAERLRKQPEPGPRAKVFRGFSGKRVEMRPAIRASRQMDIDERKRKALDARLYSNGN